MLSPNKQKQYLCPMCGNADIQKARMYGQYSGVCMQEGCKSWWPWSHRLVVSATASATTIKQLVAEYNKNSIKRRGGRLAIFLNQVQWKLYSIHFAWKRLTRRISCSYYHLMQTLRRR